MAKKHKNPAPPPFLSGPQRLNKILAAAGLGARRQVEELIEQGRVEVDGKVIDQFHVKVDPAQSKISVDGQSIRKQRPVYFAVNKPAGVLCTNRDPEGRPRVIDLVPDSARLFPVGRLDRSSVGLILLTNDGELSQRLAHPKYGIDKTYFVVVQGQIENDQLARLRRGIYLAEGVARVEGAQIRKTRKGSTELEIRLTEGKNREIRRVLARLGHKVMVLRRLAIGPLRLGNLAEGMYRPLTSDEVAALYAAAEKARLARRDAKKEQRSRKDEKEIQNRKGRKVDEPFDRLPVESPSKKPSKKSQKPPKAGQRIADDDDFEALLSDVDDWSDDDDLVGLSQVFSEEAEEDGSSNDLTIDESMIEVTPAWNEQGSIGSSQGGVIDYEEGPKPAKKSGRKPRPQAAGDARRSSSDARRSGPGGRKASSGGRRASSGGRRASSDARRSGPDGRKPSSGGRKSRPGNRATVEGDRESSTNSRRSAGKPSSDSRPHFQGKRPSRANSSTARVSGGERPGAGKARPISRKSRPGSGSPGADRADSSRPTSGKRSAGRPTQGGRGRKGFRGKGGPSSGKPGGGRKR